MARRIRFLARLILELARRHRRLIFFGAIFGSLAFFFLTRLTGIFLAGNPVEKIGLVGRYTLAGLPLAVQEKISFGLTAIGPAGQATPAAASSWQVRNQGKEYIFELNPNLVWHDGQPLVAEDVKLSLPDVTVEVISAQVVKFSLQEPFAPFPTILSQPIFKKGFVGLGDYRLFRVRRAGPVVEAIILKPSAPGKPELVYRFYPTEASAVTGFKLGEVDRLEGILSAEPFSGWPNLLIRQESRKDQYLAIFFNTTKSVFGSKNVRQALAYAIHKDTDKIRALGPIHPNSWAYNENLKPYDFDQEKIDQLLEEEDKQALAGLELTITTAASHLNLAEEIAQDWKTLGISAKSQISTALPEDFDVLILVQPIPADPDQYTFWHSTQAGNISGYQSPQLDKLLEDGRKTTDLEERKSIYRDFQRFLVEDLPAIFLYHPTVYTIERR